MTTSLHILIVDDDRRMTRTLTDILNLEGYQITQANSGQQALELAESTKFDCVLSDIKMPGIDGVELSQALHKIQPKVPIILMTAYAREDLIEEGLQAGIVAALEKPLDINQLLHFFASLSNDLTIAIVDDDPNFAHTLSEILALRGYKVHKVTDPHLPIQKMVNEVQIVLLDMKLNQINGHDILQQIRVTYPDLPVLLITGYRQEMKNAILNAMAINAHTCLYKPLEIDELLATLSEIRLRNLRLTLLKK